MISDKNTNLLYLADCLPRKYPKFYKQFEKVLTECSIEFKFLPNTKDVWAVDYMPVQINKNNFTQFVYNPKYLKSKVGQKSISDVDSICKEIDILPDKSKILVDGGNVVKTTDKIIMCDRVFDENQNLSERELIKKLEKIFQVSKIVFIPTYPKDFTGHADGIVRFLDDTTVLINQYSQDAKMENIEFQRSLRLSLHNAGLDYIEIPYNPYNNKRYDQANGAYINFLQMDDIIILPTFGFKEDNKAIRKFDELFTNQKIATVDSNDIANDGGVLNCITWNIQVN